MSVFTRSKHRISKSGLVVRFGLGFGFGLLLTRPATLDGYDVVLYRGDLASRARPHPYREPVVHGLAYLLLVLDLVTLQDKRLGRGSR